MATIKVIKSVAFNQPNLVYKIRPYTEFISVSNCCLTWSTFIALTNESSSNAGHIITQYCDDSAFPYGQSK